MCFSIFLFFFCSVHCYVSFRFIVAVHHRLVLIASLFDSLAHNSRIAIAIATMNRNTGNNFPCFIFRCAFCLSSARDCYIASRRVLNTLECNYCLFQCRYSLIIPIRWLFQCLHTDLHRLKPPRNAQRNQNEIERCTEQANSVRPPLKNCVVLSIYFFSFMCTRSLRHRCRGRAAIVKSLHPDGVVRLPFIN